MRLTEENTIRKLEDCIKWYEYGMIITPSKITMAIELIKDIAHQRDMLEEYVKRIEALPDCNNCGDKFNCSFCPEAGQSVRINCPHWKRIKQDEIMPRCYWKLEHEDKIK